MVTAVLGDLLLAGRVRRYHHCDPMPFNAFSLLRNLIWSYFSPEKWPASLHGTYNTEGSLKTMKDIPGVLAPQLWESELARSFGASTQNHQAPSSREVMFNNWRTVWQDGETLHKMRQITGTRCRRKISKSIGTWLLPSDSKKILGNAH